MEFSLYTTKPVHWVHLLVKRHSQMNPMSPDWNKAKYVKRKKYDLINVYITKSEYI